MMRRMGFYEEWISIIIRCITSVVYTVVINRRHGEEFQPQRGLKQGDPLNPFFTINYISYKGRAAFCDKVGRGNISVSHLFFADDNVLFGKASIEGTNNMKNVIKEYENVSGQLVNFDKSLIYFSGNVGRILGVRISNNPERYLGLPIMVGRRKKHAFVDIKEHFVKLLDNWSVRFLLAGGNEVFLKFVLQAVPIYALQCFKLPISFCQELESIMCKFWWRNSKTNKGIH
ncbi:reverse transcriptase [Gossypium australe]|uniref:Reverse transcriptase n=1 Tax=Gossypium australe TaxID=47621 RepID=A0A5B6UTI7_9ROSI|nr:reverse transcriptase [Gossypium australe]